MLTVRRLFMRAIGLLVLALLAPLLAIVPSVSAQSGTTCSVSSADGGIALSWTLDPAAATYVYRLEVEGANPRYGQVDGGTAFIELRDGVVAHVALSSKYADGTYEPRRSCGSGEALPGTGTQDSACTVTSADGGIDVAWTPVRGAVTYVYRLTTREFAVRYDRVSGTSTFIPLPEGIEAGVAVSAVYADGRYQPSVACGSGVATSGTGEKPFSCAVESSGDGLSLTWTTKDSAVRYVYRLEVAGQNNRYGGATGNQVDIAAGPAGTNVAVFLSGQDATGRYTPSISCGTATVGGEVPAIVITDCRIVDQGDGVTIEWDADNTERFGRVTWAYRYSWRLPGDDSLFSEVGRIDGASVRATNKIEWPVGTNVPSATVTVEFADGEITSGARAECGSATVGGSVDANITSCTVVDRGDGVTLEWEAEGIFASDGVGWVYRYAWALPGEDFTQSEVGRVSGQSVRATSKIGFPEGTRILRSTVAIEFLNGELLNDSFAVDCGTGVVGG